ncbi:MAG: TetR/AcrR family transcriptional regulator [Methylococcales bacterium]|nr:MAG: TetR/AcrR family transcriptional regulator [Methylococcales bacterium]
MARRSEHSQEQIKTMILDAAEQVVITEGFSALKARDIAKEVGYTAGSLYMVYANMADLILHIHARTLAAIALQLQQIPLSKTESVMESLALVYMNYSVQNFNRWRFIFDDHLLLGAEIPDWYQDKIDHVYAQFELQLAQLKPQLDALEIKMTATAFFAGVHGICALSITRTHDNDSIKQLEATVLILVRHFMRGWVSK